MCMPDDDVDTECAEGFHWDEDLQICVADDDTPDDPTKCPEGYVYNVVTPTCELITYPPPFNPPVHPPIIRPPQPPTPPKKPAVNTPSNQLDLADLFMALGMGGIQPSAPQQLQQVPVVGESAGFDFSSPLDVGLFGRSAQKNTQNQPGTTKISPGGYLDDLLDAIK